MVDRHSPARRLAETAFLATMALGSATACDAIKKVDLNNPFGCERPAATADLTPGVKPEQPKTLNGRLQEVAKNIVNKDYKSYTTKHVSAADTGDGTGTLMLLDEGLDPKTGSRISAQLIYNLPKGDILLTENAGGHVSICDPIETDIDRLDGQLSEVILFNIYYPYGVILRVLENGQYELASYPIVDTPQTTTRDPKKITDFMDSLEKTVSDTNSQ